MSQINATDLPYSDTAEQNLSWVIFSEEAFVVHLILLRLIGKWTMMVKW